MPEATIQKPAFLSVHPMTEKTIAFLKSIGPLTHANIVAITNDLKVYENIAIYEK